jgi:hypothetical protein
VIYGPVPGQPPSSGSTGGVPSTGTTGTTTGGNPGTTGSPPSAPPADPSAGTDLNGAAASPVTGSDAIAQGAGQSANGTGSPPVNLEPALVVGTPDVPQIGVNLGIAAIGNGQAASVSLSATVNISWPPTITVQGTFSSGTDTSGLFGGGGFGVSGTPGGSIPADGPSSARMTESDAGVGDVVLQMTQTYNADGSIDTRTYSKGIVPEVGFAVGAGGFNGTVSSISYTYNPIAAIGSFFSSVGNAIVSTLSSIGSHALTAAQCGNIC